MRGAASGAGGASALQLACRRACAKGACPHYLALGREEHALALHRRCCGPEASPYSLDDLATLAAPQEQHRPALSLPLAGPFLGVTVAGSASPGGAFYCASTVHLPHISLMYSLYLPVIGQEPGGREGGCAYFSSLALVPNAQIVFAPCASPPSTA